MATATTPRAPTADAKIHSLELAAEHGQTSCSHAAKTLGWTLDEQSGKLLSLALAIHSAHEVDTTYAVGYDAQRDDASCDCRAAQFHRPCSHRGLAILCGREVARLYAQAGRAQAERHYQRDLAAEGNAQALGYV